MKFIDLCDLAQELAEVVDDIKFERQDDKFYLVVALEDLVKVTKWLSENDIENVRISIQNKLVKLHLR